jgi:hypothetical protein
MMMSAIRSDPGVDLSLAEESNERGDRDREEERFVVDDEAEEVARAEQ